jgi:hypothetical protein
MNSSIGISRAVRFGYIATIKADSARLMVQLAATEARADKATADLAAMAQQLAELTTQLSQCEAQLAGEKTRADQFNGWRSTPGTAPLTSQLALLISTTTTKVEIGSNAVRLRLRSLTWATG